MILDDAKPLVRPVVLAVFLAIGCSKGDPETVRLRTGTHALAVHREGEEVIAGEMPIPMPIPLLEPGAKADLDPDAPLRFPPSLDPGTRVLVLKDDDKGEDNPMRRVDVKVEDGHLAGRSGKMMRWSLRATE